MDKYFANFYWNPTMARDHILGEILDFCPQNDIKEFIKLASGADLHFFERIEDPTSYEDELPGITKACELGKEIGTYNDEEPLLNMYDATHQIVRSASSLEDFIFDTNRFVTYMAFETRIMKSLPLTDEERKAAIHNLEKLSPDAEMKEFSSVVEDSMKGMAKQSGIGEEELKFIEEKAAVKAADFAKKYNERQAIILAHCKAKALNDKIAEMATDDPWLSYVVNRSQGIIFIRDGVRHNFEKTLV